MTANLSLRLRLSLGITAVLVLFFAVVGIFEYNILSKAYPVEIDNNLYRRAVRLIHEVQHVAESNATLSAEDVKKSLESASAPAQDVYVQICTVDGSVIYASGNLGAERLRHPRPEEEITWDYATLSDGSRVRQLTQKFRSTVSNQPLGFMMLGDSLDIADNAAIRAAQLLIVTRAIELALTLIVMLVLLSRGLSPLRRVAETAERIVESGDVSQRVEGGNPNDEVGRIANSFNQVVAKVESLLQAQKRLLADTSHELRNPLTVVRNNVDFLSKDLDEETRREVALETEQEIRRMISLVEDLMMLSKTENTRPVKMEPVRLDRLAREAVERLQPTTMGRTLELAQSNATPVVVGDEDRLRQILINLISNGIRYSNADSRILVRVERREGMGVVVVRDNGIGISPDHLPHIFDRFYRVDSARSRTTGGSGLGLAIVKALVDAHGGRIEVESELGKGTEFTVFIPLEETDRPRVTNMMPVLSE